MQNDIDDDIYNLYQVNESLKNRVDVNHQISKYQIVTDEIVN
ncbi:hypothetical protein ABIB18_004639 [Pantoea sp. UYEF8]